MMNSEQKAASQEVRNTPFRKLRHQRKQMNTDRRSSFSSRDFVKCPLKMDVGYLETEILIVFEDQPAISKHVQIFTSSLLSRRKQERGRGARTREKNGGLGARLVPSSQNPIFLPLPFPFPVYACYAGYFTSIVENLSFRKWSMEKKVVTQCYQTCALFSGWQRTVVTIRYFIQLARSLRYVILTRSKTQSNHTRPAPQQTA